MPVKDLPFWQAGLVYISAILIAILVTYIIVKFLKNKSDKFIFWFIFVMLLTGLATHFMKPFFPPYTEMEHPWKKLTFENICAVSILVFPFIYFSKSDVLKDYMVILGIASGIISFLIPVVILEHPVFSFEVFRFYYVHYIIFLGPYLMAKFKVHRISIYRASKVPLVLLGVLLIIFINELVITALGWVPIEELFDPTKRNPSLIFGVPAIPEGVPDGFQNITGVLTFLTPNAFMDLTLNGHKAYLPVVWMVGPVLVYISILSIITNFYFEREETKKYFLELKERRT